MEITKILSGMQNQAPANSSGSGVQAATVASVATKQASAPAPAALSSKYTYAVGNDGRRYVLQLRIDVASLGSISELA